MKRATILTVIGMLLVLGYGVPAWSCTGVTIKAADGSVVHARSLEWGGIALNSQAIIIPRGTKYVGWAYSGKSAQDNPGKQWTGRYGVVGMNMFGMPLLLDGLNEKGLACGSFFLPGFAEYQKVTPENQAKAIATGQFVTWILTQFDSVEQVRRALAEIVVGSAVPDFWQGQMPLHWIVTDSKESIVIEPIKGRLVVFEAPLGTITNSPNYDWHMINMRNWVNLRPENVKMIEWGGKSFTPLGEGSGLHGLPADFTPPSRFVRAALFSQFALQPKDAREAVLTATHVLNAFFINKGYVRQEDDGKMQYEYTNWEAFADVSGRRYYYRTYDNPSLRVIDLGQFDLKPGPVQAVPIQAFKSIDVTGDAKPLGPSN